ncbi:DeoR family transcriptional regulator [Marmoricola endophyticus]|uniref:DeoR family transcriptional regulator n=1 Tax=Marmoricola endophyticus TaxID=2040280 RepID=A0A917F6F7_9ACTN|nr:DeoR/GlpR family DNA-binding transcription regulator [Marmoricola endophyticus]GGF51091.1 DeoR family transcriptional regulator [Marmoricola endophyticus]
MFAAERQRLITDIVHRDGAVTIHDLAAAVDASEVTVRRDLRTLEEAGLVQRHHGGAMPVAPTSAEPTYAEKRHTASREKAAIAQAAARFVRDGDAVVVGAGTTTMALAAELLDRSELTVMTNSLLVAQVFADSPRIEVLLTGGMLRGSILAMVGDVAETALAGIKADVTFLSGNGLSAENGLSTPHPMVASIDRTMAAAGREVVVVADHTKFERDSVVQTVGTTQISHLVTDAAAPADELDRLRAAGVDVTIAEQAIVGDSPRGVR